MSQHLQNLMASAPVNVNNVVPDLAGVLEALREARVAPDNIVTVSQCQFGKANIEALVDEDTLAFVHPGGIVCTAGKRKMISKALKVGRVDFAQVRGYGECDYTDERGFGKYGIEFGGPGNVLLGRVHWTWKAKRFRDSSEAIMAVASERDRVLGVISEYVS